MRFSLRFLLFIVPSILVAAYLLIWYADEYFYGRQRDKSIPAWHETYQDIYVYKLGFRSIITNVEKTNLWFQSRLSETDPDAIQLENLPYRSRKIDSWDRPYIAVGLDENCVPTEDPTKVKRIGIYSLGKDGVSHSNGGDTDDIATWRWSEGVDYYDDLLEKQYWHGRKIRALVTLLVATFGILLLWLLGVVGYRMLFAKA